MTTQWGKLLGYFVAIAALTTAVVLAPAIGDGAWMPDLISREGKGIDRLYWAMVVMSIVILAGVMAIVAYSVVHFRVAPGDHSDGDPIHGHHGLELGWTIGFAVIVLVISAYSWVVLIRQEQTPAGGPGMVVQVRAFQFGWSFSYPEHGVREAADLVLEQGEFTRFDVISCSGRESGGFCAGLFGRPGTPTSQPRRDDDEGDVLHAFWVPEARLKVDAVPNIRTHTQWTPRHATGPQDVFHVVCAELCGSGHNAMRAQACVVSAEVFDWWVSAHSDVGCATLRMFSCSAVHAGDLDGWQGRVDGLLADTPGATCKHLEEAA